MNVSKSNVVGMLFLTIVVIALNGCASVTGPGGFGLGAGVRSNEICRADPTYDDGVHMSCMEWIAQGGTLIGGGSLAGAEMELNEILKQHRQQKGLDLKGK